MHCVVTTQGVAVVGTLVRSNGLAGLNFPLRVSVARNTIREIGVYGKQVTGVYVSVAGFVDVTDNVIGGSPSSGIKVAVTFIGGHRFLYNHVFDMTRETTDMGAVNIHNRDRFYVNGDTRLFQTQVRLGQHKLLYDARSLVSLIVSWTADSTCVGLERQQVRRVPRALSARTCVRRRHAPDSVQGEIEANTSCFLIHLLLSGLVTPWTTNSLCVGLKGNVLESGTVRGASQG